MIQVLSSIIKPLTSRAFTNTLMLALEPLKNIAIIHRSSMTIMLLSRKRLCEWLNNIVKCGCYIYLHIPSFDYLLNEVISSKCVFGSPVRSRLLTLCYRTIDIRIGINEIHNFRIYVEFYNDFFDTNGLFCFI